MDKRMYPGGVGSPHIQNMFNLRLKKQTITASGAIDLTKGSIIEVNDALALTIAKPIEGMPIIITRIGTGTTGTTITLTSGTWDGTNKIATLDAVGETIAHIGLSASRFLQLVNVGTVAYSS